MSKEATIISDKEFDDFFSDEKEVLKPNAFTSKPEKSDIDKMLDNEKTEEEIAEEERLAKEKLEKDKSNKDIDNFLDEDLENSNDNENSDDTVPASNMYKAVETLVENGVLKVFVDDKGNPEKDLKDYTTEEIHDLIKQNIEDAVETTAISAPNEIFSKLPVAVQDVVNYALKGAKEDQIKGLFLQLAQVQDTLDLNPEKEEDARKIIRQHLQLENLHTTEEIEDQITKIEDLGKTTEYATKYKKVLDAKQAAVLQKRIADQEEIAKQQQAKELAINKTFFETLRVPFEDLDLDVKTRESLYHGLVQKKHQNEKGEAINELEYLIKQKSSGTKEDAETLVKAFAYLKSPKDFMDSLEKKLKAKIQKELTIEVKDANSRNATTSVSNEREPEKRRTIGLPKKGNFFSR